MKETLNIIINNPALWFLGFAIIIILYAFVKYIIPWLFEKPKGEIAWFAKIGAILMILGIIRMLTFN